MYYSTTHPSPVGTITLACQDNKLVGLWLEGQKYFGDTIPENMREKDDIPVFHDAKKWLDRYFAGEKPEISQLSMAPIGGEFRQMVWDILCAIPYGEVTTYGSIAKEVTAKTGKNMSAQAVGGAVGHNPISIIIPCHRVVGSTGSLTGYAGGVETKIKLLELEGVDTSQFFIPKKGTAL
ncbi:MAG: methylated-DNA--[protein]-cysteine S-methyltransferase [Firmicutes bacterium]|jgi:methylated-DNA-[protein]-cysteine S-methyltransferase|nr:methylated-DNA--[protein]-cysteine S-methyltransferase [Bacillota bacterium]NBI64486.1 methylated-DNA--[protein]-cysteine S-methyltransferase [Clostridiales bacterium]